MLQKPEPEHQQKESESESKSKLLDDEWKLYIHYPNDKNWDLSSYRLIYTFKYLEEAIVLFHTIETELYSKCMLFLMRNDIKPTWEDPSNVNGGAFSFKIENRNIKRTWQLICYQAMGETLYKNMENCKHINGITLSPKKNFSIIKVWTNDCRETNPDTLNYYDKFQSTG